MQWCGRCNSRRKGNFCWKCGTETHTVVPSWPDLRKPSVLPIREVAREVGYAISVHGSGERDLDLVATPWTENAVTCNELITHLLERLSLTEVGRRSFKPHGRVAVSLARSDWYKMLDISILPLLPSPTTSCTSSVDLTS